jgi:PknH-like extracellular domain
LPEPQRTAGPPQPPRRPSEATRFGPPPGPPPGWQPQPGYPPRQGFPPQGFPPPPGYSAPPPIYPHAPARNNGKVYLIIGAVVAVIVVAVAAIVLLQRDNGATSATSSTSALPTATSPAPRTTTSATPTPVNVEPARLPQLLLAPDAISNIMGVPGMRPGPVQRSTDITANDSVVDPLECSSTWGPGKPWQYLDAGYIGLARQLVAEQPTPQHEVTQAVIAFADDIGVRKSYRSQVKAWMSCQGKTVTAHLNGSTPDQSAVIGAASDNGDVATLQVTPNVAIKGLLCQRVLMPTGNVLIDVRACSMNVGDAGVTVARDIAAKING